MRSENLKKILGRIIARLSIKYTGSSLIPSPQPEGFFFCVSERCNVAALVLAHIRNSAAVNSPPSAGEMFFQDLQTRRIQKQFYCS